MKKIIIIFAMTGFIVTGITKVADAQTQQEQSQTAPQEKSEFKSIDLTDLPEDVKTAARENDAAAIIQSAEVKTLTTGDKVYRVNLKSTAKGEYSLKFNADGSAYEKK